jgi:hypothetical protein
MWDLSDCLKSTVKWCFLWFCITNRLPHSYPHLPKPLSLNSTLRYCSSANSTAFIVTHHYTWADYKWALSQHIETVASWLFQDVRLQALAMSSTSFNSYLSKFILQPLPQDPFLSIVFWFLLVSVLLYRCWFVSTFPVWSSFFLDIVLFILCWDLLLITWR